MWIFGIVVLPGRAQSPDSNITTCEEFERGARFNPYEVIDSMWKIIYFWADNTELYPIVFSLPAKKVSVIFFPESISVFTNLVSLIRFDYISEAV